MIIEYEAIVIGAAAVAAVLVWNKIHVWKRIRAIDAELARMRKEIDVLQTQESRRLLMEMKASPKVEAPTIDPRGDPVEIGSNDVVRLLKTPPTSPAQ